MAVREFGSYVAGGSTLVRDGLQARTLSVTQTASYLYDPNGTYAIEHAWVQYFIPVARNNQPPVVLLHGGGLHGGMWDTTPDGRPGWTQQLVARGFEVHVVDNVERGRAGWIPEVWPDQPILRNLEDAWTLFRFGDSAGFSRREPFEGCRFPVEHLETLGRYCCPRWLGNTAAQIAAFGDVLNRLGTATVICHSQGGEVALKAAAHHPEHIAGLIAIEPSGFANTLDGFRHIPLIIAAGDHLKATPLWQSLSVQWHDVVETINRAGGAARLVNLAQNWPGTTHMPMMDQGSEQMLDNLLETLAALAEKSPGSPKGINPSSVAS